MTHWDFNKTAEPTLLEMSAVWTGAVAGESESEWGRGCAETEKERCKHRHGFTEEKDYVTLNYIFI